MKKYTYLLVGAGPVLVLLLALVIFEWSAPSLPGFTPKATAYLGAEENGATSIMALDEARARYAWLATVLLNICVPLCAMVCLGHVIWQSLPPVKSFWAAIIILILSAGGIGFLFQSIASENALHRLVFDFTHDALHQSERFSELFLGRVSILISIINALAVIAPNVALVACVSTVAPRNGGEETVEQLRTRTRRLKETINASAAILVSGILHMSVWLRWPAALVGDEAARKGIEQFTLAVTLFWGLTFTLMIVSAYLPATMMLRERAERLHRRAGGKRDADPEVWLKEHGLSFSIGKQLPQVAVMLAPLLAGPASTLFNSLAGMVQ